MPCFVSFCSQNEYFQGYRGGKSGGGDGFVGGGYMEGASATFANGDCDNEFEDGLGGR